MSKPCILIIEPSEELAAVLARALRRKGFLTKVAHSAQEGVKLADEQTPSMVIMELIMPAHNGMEFIYEFRSYPEWLDVPIIIYSQLAAKELGLSSQTMGDMGISRHLYKPTTSLDELARTAEEAFAQVNN